MTDQKWSKEPWRYLKKSNHIRDAELEPVCKGSGFYSYADMERAVACINACAGIPTDKLESVIEAGKLAVPRFLPYDY